jgi:hypothetical protein
VQNDPDSEQKDSTIRSLQADNERETEKRNRNLDEFRRAQFGFDRAFFEAEKSASSQGRPR